MRIPSVACLSALACLAVGAATWAKAVVVDTDHIAPWDHDPAWPWKCLLRGHHVILMDGYRDFRIGSPPAPKGEWDVTRRAMGHAAHLAAKIDLAGMTPQGHLASSGYCLASAGKKYLVYLPSGGEVTVDLSAAAGQLARSGATRPTVPPSQVSFPEGRAAGCPRRSAARHFST